MFARLCQNAAQWPTASAGHPGRSAAAMSVREADRAEKLRLVVEIGRAGPSLS
jgi:hypothetical protein